MPQVTAKTYGFGRVSPQTRPSPYSPVHLPSIASGSASAGDEPSARARPTTRRLRAAAIWTVAIVVAASALAAAGLLRASTPLAARAADGSKARTLVAADDEAGRIARSPFAATSRAARP